MNVSEFNPTYHIYLQYTNLLLVLTILYFFQYSKKTMIEYILVLFLISVIISSQLFWNDPIKGSMMHKIDAIIAKIVIITLILYTLIYKFRISLLFFLFVICVSFYLSNYYSNQEWCGDDHIFWHGIAHVSCFLSTLYTFSPV
jgi:hypothetical protein